MPLALLKRWLSSAPVPVPVPVPVPAPTSVDPPTDADEPTTTVATFLDVLRSHPIAIEPLDDKTVLDVLATWRQRILRAESRRRAAATPWTGDELQTWAGLRLFLLDHRLKERVAVKQSLQELRRLIWAYMHRIGANIVSDRGSDARVRDELDRLKAAAEGRSKEELRQAVDRTIAVIGQLVDERQERHRRELTDLGDKLRTMRQELDRARKDLETDGLTGLYNRAALDEHLVRIYDLCLFSGKPASLLMVDVDHFKKVNDTYGHQAGDAVLRRVAELCLRTFPRRSDFVGRYGGEEIAIIMQEDGLDGARIVGERLLKALRELTIDHDGRTIKVTASIGAAEFDPAEPLDKWLKRADMALYEAKRQGRDRFIAG